MVPFSIKIPKIDTLDALGDAVRYPQDMTKICQKYTQDMPMISPRYATDMTKSRKHQSLTH